MVIAAAIVAGGIAYGRHMKTISNEFVSANNRLTQAIEEENFESAGYITDKIKMYMEKKKTVLAATDNHEVLDKIEINLQELVSYIEGRQKADALSKCRVLGYLYERLPTNYELRLENIL